MRSLDRFDQAASQLSEVGQNNIRILRNWAKSKGWEKETGRLGKPERWGLYNGKEFTWHLRIKPEKSLREGLQAGSQQARFDARLNKEMNGFLNPFTGKTGNKDLGTHLSLESEWYFYGR